MRLQYTLFSYLTPLITINKAIQTYLGLTYLYRKIKPCQWVYYFSNYTQILGSVMTYPSHGRQYIMEMYLSLSNDITGASKQFHCLYNADQVGDPSSW